MKSRKQCALEQEEIFAMIFGYLSDDTESSFKLSRNDFESFLLEYTEHDWLHYLAGNRHTKMCEAIDRINQYLGEDAEYSNDELYSLLRQHELFERYHHRYTGESDETLQNSFCSFIRRLIDRWEELAANEEDKVWALNQTTAMIDDRQYMLETTQREVEKAENFLASRKIDDSYS
jgi:hypothetical protein